MPLYRCRVITDLGKNSIEELDASDPIELKALFRARNYILLKYSVIKDKEPNVFFSVSSKVKRSEIVMFLRQFSVLINSSLTISDSLQILKSQSYTPVFKKVVMEVYRDVVSGLLLSEAFAKHDKVFPGFFVEMVAIGEVSGSLDNVLKEMADYYEKDQKIKNKAKSSMAYPTILLVMIFAVILFMTFVILPQFEDMFAGFGSAEIPGITKVIFSISGFIREYIGVIIIAASLIALIIVLFFRSAAGRKVKDFIALKFPFIGKINNAVITSRFAKAFIILLNSGMNITDCMENLKRILDNSLFGDRFDLAINEVKRGKSIANSIKDTDMFPSILTEMIGVGEKSGNLEEVLSSTTSFFDDEVERSISKATAALEPLMLIILGSVVAIVLLSVYLPMIDLMNTI